MTGDCCSTAAQESCCEPADKQECCGEATGNSCGCKSAEPPSPLPMVDSDPPPVACSLDAVELGERLRRISRLGARSWTGTDSDGRRHSLSFRNDRETRAELGAVIAAERQCCPFLSLALDEGEGELVLTIDAGPEGGPIAAELARAFASA